MNDIEAGVGTFAAHCEGYGMGPIHKFKVGDKVKRSAHWIYTPREFVGVVVEVHEGGIYPYSVEIDADGSVLFAEEELELAE